MDFVAILRIFIADRSDDELGDRINHMWSSVVLFVFGIVVGTNQYVGRKIDCWCPAQFTESFIRYTNSICWVNNTYYIPMSKKVPEGGLVSEKPQIIYYQWIPLLLLFMAFLYQIPCLFWRSYNYVSGISIKTIIYIARLYDDSESSAAKDNCIKMMTNIFGRYLDTRKRYDPSKHREVIKKFLKIFFLQDRRYGNHLTLLYLTTKILYLFNTLGQFYLIEMLLTTGSLNFFGIQIFLKFVSGNPFEDSIYFPRVTLCDFYIRDLGHEVGGEKHTVQCILSINLFNRAIFGFYWFWLVMVNIVNIVSLSKWFWYFLVNSANIGYVRKHVRKELLDKANTDSILKEFVTSYLRADGVLTLRMMSHNASDLVVDDLVSVIFENFKLMNLKNGPQNISDYSKSLTN